MNNAILSIGSNYADRSGKIQSALEYLDTLGLVLNHTAIYECPDYIKGGEPYLNAIVEIETDLNETSFSQRIKAFEIESGRDTLIRLKGYVPLDIDVVIWNGEVKRPTDFKSAYFQIGFKRLSIKTHKIQ